MQLLRLMVICAAVGYSAAYYHDSPQGLGLRDVIEPRDVIENYETAVQKRDEELVACPVCDQFLDDECTVLKNGKRYKKCAFGTYINEVCGNQRDCYRNPVLSSDSNAVPDATEGAIAKGRVSTLLLFPFRRAQNNALEKKSLSIELSFSCNGPKQYCTEKMAEDKLGAKCAHGYTCNAQLHECVGLFNELDSLQLAGLRHYYILPEDNTNSYIDKYRLARSHHLY
ncbi:hypothetical protein EVAR_87693_1 [Eumeta japonica]|uniref:Uncharacterized protein n=1 Tax=Eumeta variegata TaxID=151549 RepID=A0A4C1XIK7_EUMVA|nr:hypothetical protein EVAR_87693_1 [Eumeta japonica]